MFETIVDVIRLAAAGAVGGLIYWAARPHGAILVDLWNALTRATRN